MEAATETEMLKLGQASGGHRLLYYLEITSSQCLPIGPKVVPFWDYLIEF